MDPRYKASLLWGFVGGLAFLVCLQAYHLLGGDFAGWAGVGILTLTVAGTSAGITYWLRPRLAARNERA